MPKMAVNCLRVDERLQQRERKKITVFKNGGMRVDEALMLCMKHFDDVFVFAIFY